jgi:(N-acetylneuraminyl)-galactosylglucosylceramide N-acetylgalactosaminyltransferase
MPPTHSAPGGGSPWADLEADLTVVVKTFERPDALTRLLGSIREHYARIPIVVIDDSAEPLDPVPESISRYVHAPYDSLGAAGGRNEGLRHVETPYVLFSDDDMVFEQRTDLGRMLYVLESTPFDVVACTWLDFDPWRGVCRGLRRFEGTLEVEDGLLVHRLGEARGSSDGLPVYDIVHQFFVASVERIGPEPWDPALNLFEHYELFLSFGDRGLLCTSLRDVVVQHRQQRPQGYDELRAGDAQFRERWLAKRGFRGLRTEGTPFHRSDSVRYRLPGLTLYNARRVSRAGRRLVREGRLRA